MSPLITFGEWRFKPEALQLARDTYSVQLEPRVGKLLEFLLRHPGEVHSHDRLVEAVWEGRVVSDEAVRRAVSSLRQAMAGGGEKGMIRTVPRRGYIAEIPTLTDAGGPGSGAEASTPERTRARCPRAVIAGASLLVTASVLGWLVWALVAPVGDYRPADPVYRIAVIPFDDLGPQGEPDHFSEGLAEELLGLLCQYENFRVAARSSSYRHRETRLGTRELADRLGVRYLIDGSIRRDRSQLRIAVSLVDSHTGYRLWSQMYQAPASGLIEVQQDISQQVARALQVVLVQGATSPDDALDGSARWHRSDEPAGVPTPSTGRRSAL